MFLLLDCIYWVQSVQFSSSVVSNSLQPHRLQHTRLHYSSPSPRPCSNSCPWSWWCHPNISSSVIPFSSCLQSFPASGSFPVSWLFTSGGQRIGISASVPPKYWSITFFYPQKLLSSSVWKHKVFGLLSHLSSGLRSHFIMVNSSFHMVSGACCRKSCLLRAIFISILYCISSFPY